MTSAGVEVQAEAMPAMPDKQGSGGSYLSRLGSMTHWQALPRGNDALLKD